MKHGPRVGAEWGAKPKNRPQGPLAQTKLLPTLGPQGLTACPPCPRPVPTHTSDPEPSPKSQRGNTACPGQAGVSGIVRLGQPGPQLYLTLWCQALGRAALWQRDQQPVQSWRLEEEKQQAPPGRRPSSSGGGGPEQPHLCKPQKEGCASPGMEWRRRPMPSAYPVSKQQTQGQRAEEDSEGCSEPRTPAGLLPL